ncbi:hypothetical protein RHGRI_036224 [Rhododendron griersonianum]|uniref:Sodium/calcium exchanger membrane region domain-containing protein n=1 Tax=Rhododendron griersonianum TaxID=479676 RepID=A0AAV6HR44_9ERIC|nr:hypothetical protein RHGRI_036224 [Rhododendron griersonianum]
MGSLEHLDLENGDLLKKGTMGKEENLVVGRTAQNISASLVRKKSDPMLLSKVRFQMVRVFLANIQEVIIGTKLCLLFPAIPLAILAECYEFGRPWVFALSLLGLTPLAERVSFLTEQIAYYTGPTVGGLLNATCGNATELIIALFALYQRKIHVKQSDVNMLLLLLGFLCLLLPLMFRYAVEPGSLAAGSILHLSRASSIMMLLAYFAYLFFQLKTHRQLFETNEEVDDSDDALISEEKAVIGFWSAFIWLAGMTVVISLLSEYIVDTIEVSLYIKTFIINLPRKSGPLDCRTDSSDGAQHPPKAFILNGNYCLLK